MKVFCWFFILLCACCTHQSVSGQIEVVIIPEGIIIDKKEIPFESFEKELMKILLKMDKAGIDRSLVVANLKVSGTAKRGRIADVEATMRRMNLRKVVYSTFAN